MKSPFKHLISAISRQRLGRLTSSVFLLFTTVTSQSTILLFAPSSLKVAAQTAQVCAAPGKDGPAAPTGVINTYYPGTANAAVGATSITIGASTGSGNAIAPGDLLLVIQMQDATINSNNTGAYGDGAAGDPATGSTPNNSGIYEYVVATNSVGTGGGTVNISSGLLNSYANAVFDATTLRGQRRFQVVRVPQYSSVTSLGSVTATPWNGTTGGIVVFDVAGSLNLGGGSINVSGQGFRGGGGRALAGGTGGTSTDYVNLASRNFHGAKGEGIAGTPRFVYNGSTVTDNTAEGYPNGSSGRGAPGNAGGGGTDANPTANDQNSGGGGGSNGGAGGKGGNAWSSNATVGGFGGAGFTNAANRLVLGGGGGAGNTNNATGTPGSGVASSGAAGGGIVIIRAGTVAGTGTISADGAAANNTVANDGSGGGGAGGSVLVTAGSGTLGTLTVNAQGGTGGTNTGGGSPHGPGGGGGGGFVALSSAATTNVSGGANGTTSGSSAFGATSGANGLTATITSSQTPSARSGTECIPNLSVTKTTSTANVTNTASGTTATYTITVSNPAGRGTANNISISDALPAGFTYASPGTVTLTGGATRSTTPVNPTAGATNPSFGTFTIPGGGSVAIPFTVNIASTASGVYQNPATATYDDPVRTTTAGTATATYNSASSTGEDVNVRVPPTIDLDGDNSSTATGNNYQNTFTAGGAAVRAADTDVSITDEKNFINSATITLTNRPDGNAVESLSIDATAGGTVSGVTASAYDAATGRITLTSNTAGTITLAQYQAIIATLKYNNTLANPSTATNRTINVQVTDSDGLASNTAVSTISVAAATSRFCRGTNISLLSFQGTPTLVSGTALAVGAVYRFSNVSPGVDALVKIDSFNNGATLGIIDEDNTATNGGYVQAFQPQLKTVANATDSSVDFTISFVQTGTSTPTTISNLHASGIDIDGDNAAVREYIELSDFSRYTLDNPTELTPTFTPPRARFASKTVNNRQGIDIAATANVATGEYTNVSAFSYRIGALGGSGAAAQTRLASLYFDCVAYTNPVSNATPTPPTIDLDGDNSSGATGNNYQNTFTAGGAAVRAADTDVKITDEKNFINSATITLTNRPDGNAVERLSIDATAGGTVSGVTASAYDAATGRITLTSNTAGTITLAQYQAIIATLKYNNTAANPNTTTNRTINVQVTDSDSLASNTAVSTISVRTKASLLLVKRITAIDSTPITNVVDDPGDPNDTNPNWPSGALQGAITGSVQPKQEVEYTIYFLSTGGSDAANARMCDLVPANTTFVPDAFGAGKGISLTQGTTPTNLTNANDAPDQGRFYTTAEPLPSVCSGSNVNGAVVVDLGTVPKANGPSNPPNSYGFVRFRARVN